MDKEEEFDYIDINIKPKPTSVANLIAMTPEKYKEDLRLAFEAGFNCTGEGYNGEHGAKEESILRDFDEHFDNFIKKK